MDVSVLIAAFALGVSAIGFFYKLGRDTKANHSESEGKSNESKESKLDQIYKSTEKINDKLDEIAKWQQKAAEIHASHEERIKTLFNRVERVESRMEDREVMTDALKKILERMC